MVYRYNESVCTYLGYTLSVKDCIQIYQIKFGANVVAGIIPLVVLELNFQVYKIIIVVPVKKVIQYNYLRAIGLPPPQGEGRGLPAVGMVRRLELVKSFTCLVGQ